MLNPKEAITKIKELLNLEFATSEQKFYTGQLEDGTQVTNNTDSEDLQLGDTLYVVVEDGNIVPAPGDMEHTLATGEVVRLDIESKVTEIKVEEETPADETPDEAEIVIEAENTEEEMADHEDKEEIEIEVKEDDEMSKLREEMAEIKKALSQVLDVFSQFSASTEEGFEKVNQEIESFKKSPEVENIKTNKLNNKKLAQSFAEFRTEQLKKYLK
jgi:major membrane immunogen (membrane-anchored lipoprotein)